MNCQCSFFGNVNCRHPMTQEDGLCDGCRERRSACVRFIHHDPSWPVP